MSLAVFLAQKTLSLRNKRERAPARNFWERNRVEEDEDGRDYKFSGSDSGSASSSPVRLSWVAKLRRTMSSTSLRKQRKEFTILLVGESGVGKTSFLTFVYNFVRGYRPDQYVPYHEAANEAGGSQAQSQTQAARVYEFVSADGFKIRIVDTPGIADTRGLAQDQLHRQNIVTTVQQGVPSVDAVLVLANGTNPRLGVATDYALTTLTSILPRDLLPNLAILFTNVSSPLSWNFEPESLPDCLRNSEQFLLDNPVALAKKLTQIESDPRTKRNVLRSLRQGIGESHTKALSVLAEMLDWINTREPQPTENVPVLNDLFCKLDQRITDAVRLSEEVKEEKQKLSVAQAQIDQAKADMKTYRNYETYVKNKIHVQKDTRRHNVCCTHPGCYSTCDLNCSLSFTLDPAKLVDCDVIGLDGKCTKCGHGYKVHRHLNSKWDIEERKEKKVDHSARGKFLGAQTRLGDAERLKSRRKELVTELEVRVESLMYTVRSLLKSYADLAMGGTLDEQVAKSIRLLETNLESVRNDPGSDRKTVTTAERDLATMQAKRDFLGKVAALKDPAQITVDRRQVSQTTAVSEKATRRGARVGAEQKSRLKKSLPKVPVEPPAPAAKLRRPRKVG